MTALRSGVRGNCGWRFLPKSGCTHHRTTDRKVSGGRNVAFQVCFVDHSRDRMCQSHSSDFDGHGCEVDPSQLIGSVLSTTCSATRREVRRRRTSPTALSPFGSFTDKPSASFWDDELGNTQVIQQGEGGEQGDPMPCSSASVCTQRVPRRCVRHLCT